MHELDSNFANWRQQMARAGIVDVEILGELESHLREDVEFQVAGGTSPEAAFRLACEQMGPGSPIGIEFEKVRQARRARWWQGFRCSAVIFAGLIFLGAGMAVWLVLPLANQANAVFNATLGLPPISISAMSVFSYKLMAAASLLLAVPGGLVAGLHYRLWTGRQLARFRPWAIVINLVLAAALTTPEVLTQILAFVPLQGVFELAILADRLGVGPRAVKA